MKHIQLLLVILLILGLNYCHKNTHKSKGGPKPTGNPYKDDLKVKHSLFREKDDLERMSAEFTGIPEYKTKNKGGKIEVKEPERVVALRVVDNYRKIFDYLDFSPVDDLIDWKELCVAYKDYNWPKIFEAESDEEYCRRAITKFDHTKKKALNFVEFCEYMESLWTAYDKSYINRVKAAYMKSKDAFFKLFYWLDRDNDGFITQQDMLFGISKIMLKDASIKEIRKVFQIYDKKKTGKINLNSFMLSVINGDLNVSFEDPLVTDNFIHQ